jgi:hypothetical protein
VSHSDALEPFVLFFHYCLSSGGTFKKSIASSGLPIAKTKPEVGMWELTDLQVFRGNKEPAKIVKRCHRFCIRPRQFLVVSLGTKTLLELRRVAKSKSHGTLSQVSPSKFCSASFACEELIRDTLHGLEECFPATTRFRASLGRSDKEEKWQKEELWHPLYFSCSPVYPAVAWARENDGDFPIRRSVSTIRSGFPQSHHRTPPSSMTAISLGTHSSK